MRFCNCIRNWTVATCQARQTWQVQQQQQRQPAHFRLATSLASACLTACLPAPVYHLPSTVYCLRSPTPWGDSFYATLFVCLLRVSLFHLDCCSVTGTRWYSEYASKFVSFYQLPERDGTRLGDLPPSRFPRALPLLPAAAAATQQEFVRLNCGAIAFGP